MYMYVKINVSDESISYILGLDDVCLENRKELKRHKDCKYLKKWLGVYIFVLAVISKRHFKMNKSYKILEQYRKPQLVHV